MRITEKCGTCGQHCTDAYDCRINVDLARDGVDPSVYRNPLAGDETSRIAREHEARCAECSKSAVGVMFTAGVPQDVPLCRKCGNAPKYAGWKSQSLTTAASATGRMIRSTVKGGARS